MVQGVITLGSAVLITILGVLASYRSSFETIRRWFLAFCLSISSWQIAFWLSNLQINQALIFNELTFVGPLLAEGFFVIFVDRLGMGQGKPGLKRISKLVLVSVFLVIIGVISCFVPNGVVAGIYPFFDHGAFAGYSVRHGSLYIVYLVAFIVVAFSIITLLVRLVRSKNPVTRQQARLVATGVILAILFGLLTNIILPLILKSSVFSYLGSFAVLILVVSLSIAIARYKLIDVRLVVARSLAYTLFVTVVASVYGLTTFLLTTYVFNVHLSTGTLVIVALPAALIGLTFGGVKKMFTRTTDHLFFQDAYDPQAFLNQLNKALVGNIDLERLLKTSSEIIASNLRVEYCLFGIKETQLKGVRIIGTTKKEFKGSDILEVRHESPRLGLDVIVTDFLPNEANSFKHLLAKNDIAVLARLVPKLANDKHAEGLGYIILGQKRSGNLYTDQDVQVLTIIANELVIAIQNALRFEEIQRFNVTLQEEVDTATRKLKRQNKRLEELDNIKDDFISMASHQLRTPLTSVKGYLSMVLEGDAGKLNGTEEQMLKQAFASSQRMVFLITDLLNVSRLKTGKFVIDAAPTNLKNVVEQELAQLRETAAAKNLELLYTPPKTFPELMLDEVKIRQVIMNFVDNAIYYTPAGGRIKVELEEKPSTIELRVVDNGIGVPKSEQHHLFTKFYRATNARTARPDGTGLGLFMAQKVVVAQGGSVIFQSREGQGSTFGFSFSKSRLAVKKVLVAAGSQTVKPAPESVATH